MGSASYFFDDDHDSHSNNRIDNNDRIFARITHPESIQRLLSKKFTNRLWPRFPTPICKIEFLFTWLRKPIFNGVIFLNFVIRILFLVNFRFFQAVASQGSDPRGQWQNLVFFNDRTISLFLLQEVVCYLFYGGLFVIGYLVFVVKLSAVYFGKFLIKPHTFDLKTYNYGEWDD